MSMEMMVDIETLATDERALVLTMGFVEFNNSGAKASQRWILDMGQQMEKGRAIDPETIAWWMRQGDAARKEAFAESRSEIVAALWGVHRFFIDVDPISVWANSPSFDLTILETLFRDFDVDLPWAFYQARDVRTLREESGLARDWQPENITYTAHTAIGDCCRQIEIVRECRRLNGILY